MRYRPVRLAAAIFTATFATLASAQANVPGQTADNGFFRPAPDPVLTTPLPREPAPANPAARPARPTENLTAEDRVQANDETVARDRAPDPLKVLEWNERQMDRSEEEAAKMRPPPNAPAPINGAFTGLTDERDRR
jgi:hypothetical protein